MRTDLILWDWNGTLLDDVRLCVDALNRLLARFRYSQRYDLAQYREIFGFPIVDYYIRAGFDFGRDSFEELARAYMEDYIPSSEACGLTEGAPELLRQLGAAGVRQVILSASRLEALERQVEDRGIRPCFDALLGLGDIYAKSKIEVGLQYLQTCTIPREHILMVGDSVHDFEVASALGVRCVLFSGGHQARHFLEATGAPIADSLRDVGKMLLPCGETGQKS